MTNHFVKHAIQNGIARVTLTRSEIHNAFNDEMINQLVETFQTVGKDESVRVVVLDAEGKSFCAGADLKWMKKMVDYSFEENVVDALGLARMLKTIHDCPKPVIARVHGAAFGGGVGLITACDMAVCLDSVTFALTEVKLGLIPAVISPFLLKKMPASAAHRYFLTAEKFNAQEARRFGIVSEVVSTEAELDAWIDSVIAALKANGPEAVMVSKELISKVINLDWGSAMKVTSEMIASRRISAEGQEGMRSFLEKRPAAWLEASPATTV